MWIPIEQCYHRRLYLVDARNFRIAVYSAENRSFFGIRTKWKRRYVDLEYHWDTGGPYGTAKPLEDLEESFPSEISLSLAPWLPDATDSEELWPLFVWLLAASARHGDEQE